MDADEKATKDEPQLGEIARRCLESVPATDETGTKKAVTAEAGTGTKGRHMASKTRKKAPDMDIDLLSAKLTLAVVGTSDPERQRLLDRMLTDENSCRGVGIAQDWDGPSDDVMVMALMKDGWHQAGSLAPEDAEAISEVVGVVSIVDWDVHRYLDGRPLGLRINVSIS